MNKKIILVIAFLIYFFFIIIYGLKVIVDFSYQKNYTRNIISTQRLKNIGHCLSAVLLHTGSPQRHNNLIDLYLAATGSNTGFVHFAYVPPSYKLLFELEFKGGTEQTVLPKVGSTEIGLRLNDLLTTIVTTSDESLQNVLAKRLAENELSIYPNVKKINVVIGVVEIPPPGDFIKNPGFYFHYFYQYTFIPKQ